jgi:Flp pilus assembly protein TadB
MPKRPYRDSAILYAVLSLAIVLVAWLTGGGLVRAVLVAVAFFVVATGWSWWRFRERQREAERR